MTTALIDYGSGNLRSAAKALERAGRESGGDERVAVTADPDEIARADRIVLPGVGAFGDCKQGIEAVPGLKAAIEERVTGDGVPFLGICVGMQLMATIGHEHGDHVGFGWIPGAVSRIRPDDPALKIPHMGWNDIHIHRHDHPVLVGLESAGGGQAYAYFVHSYALHPVSGDHLLATVDYGGHLSAIVGEDNRLGTQFHPEKSQAVGLRLLANFLCWRP